MNIDIMKKEYFFLVILSCYFISCKPSIDDKRKATMTEIVNAIIRNDTNKVFKLIDTSYCFNIVGEDGFMYKIHSLNDALSKQQTIRNQDFIRTKMNDWDATYEITFPLKSSDFGQTTIEFEFSTGVFSTAYYLDASFKRNLDASFKRNKPELIDATPSGN